MCAAALVFRVSSGRLVRRLSPFARRPPCSYNAEDLPDQPHFSQDLHFFEYQDTDLSSENSIMLLVGAESEWYFGWAVLWWLRTHIFCCLTLLPSFFPIVLCSVLCASVN